LPYEVCLGMGGGVEALLIYLGPAHGPN
jgi:hypothetical protein